jgi:hypothetical protein
MFKLVGLVVDVDVSRVCASKYPSPAKDPEAGWLGLKTH